MKKLFVIIALLFSSLTASPYGEGYKLYKKAKHILKNGDVNTANTLFLQAKAKFEKAKNSSAASMKLAELYCNGWGVKADGVKAAEYLSLAKKLGANPTDACLKKLK